MVGLRGCVHLGSTTTGGGSSGGFATRLVHVYANFLQQGNESTDANIVSVQPPCNEMIELLI